MQDKTTPSPDPTPPAACCGCAHAEADPGRRATLRLVAGAALAAGAPLAWADDGPRSGDLLVKVDDDSKTPLKAADIKVGEKPVIVWPFDAAAKAPRDGSRLNRILLVRVEPATLDGPTKERAADGGVVAYSAFCTHQGCDVNAWVAADKQLLCFCHFSKFAPEQEAAVVGGPAPRPLPALPIKLDGDRLAVAGAFSAPPGKAA